MTALKVYKGGRYIDATLGAGGHSEAILKLGGELLAIEADEKMKFTSEERIKSYCPTLVRGNFQNISQIARTHDFVPVDGVLFDLGISNLHYEEIGRGFSFRKSEEPLDMRLAPADTDITAATLLNMLSEKQLSDLFSDYLNKSQSLRLAKEIVEKRTEKPFEIVSDLAHMHSQGMAEVFLALRIAVNGEYEAIKKGLQGAFEILKEQGRIVVISFHSLEDQLVMNQFHKLVAEQKAQLITEKPIAPSQEELAANSKARSALLRILQK